MLIETNIPPALLPQARTWFNRQLVHLEQMHGNRWPEHRQWLIDYLNEDVRQRVLSMEINHAI